MNIIYEEEYLYSIIILIDNTAHTGKWMMMSTCGLAYLNMSIVLISKNLCGYNIVS